jgi:hypothetical protein
MSPAGKADLQRAGTVSRVRIEVERVQPPGSLGTGLNTYVVWTVSPEGVFDNIGSLEVENGKGRLEATTRFEQFGILITAEPHYMVDRPNSAIAFQNQSPRNEEVRRLTIPVNIGFEDYSAIQLAPQGALPSLIVQSRTAFQIARNAEAERWAQAEFRQARVALDTTEEMLKRAAPLEILEPSANETIRRSQQAIVMVRERVAAAALDDVKNQLVTREREKAEAQAAIEQLTEQQKMADSRIQRLQSELAEAERGLQRLNLEVEQSEERLRGAERDKAEFARREEELNNSLSFLLREDFFAESQGSKVLTADGSEALTRISNVFALMPAGPIRIRASFADAAVQALVREFLVKAGVPADRIILIQE